MAKKMKIICFAYLVVMLSTVVTYATTIAPVLRPTFQITKGTVAEGEHVGLLCIVRRAPPDFVAIWNKRTFRGEPHRLHGANHTSGNADEAPLEIGTSYYLNEPFTKLHRYVSNYSLPTPGDFSLVHFELNIYNASTEDSGYYSCKVSVGSASQESERVLLQVVSPVKDIWWELFDERVDPQKFRRVTSNERLSAEDGDKLSVRCRSEGAFPAPILTVTREEGHETKHSSPAATAVDMTTMFKLHSLREEGPGPKNLRPVHFNTTLEPHNDGQLILNYDLNEKVMVCSAKVNNHPDPSKREKKAELVIFLTRYAPKIICPDKMKTKPNEKNFEISCLVRALPVAKDFRFIFMNATNVTDLTGQSKTKLDVINNGTSDEHVRVTLTIYRVSWSHFGKYELFAWNDKGNSTHIVELVKENFKETKSPQFSAAEGSSGGSSKFSFSTISFVVAIFGRFFLILLVDRN